MSNIAAQFNEDNAKQVIIVKVAILGDSQIGKTTLMVKYIEDKFDEEFIETLGLNVMEKSFELKNCIANLQIYDLGGQRQFAELMPTAMEGTKAVIFAFSLIQDQSLSSVKKWYKDARKLNKVFRPVLVGTKYDLFAQWDMDKQSATLKKAREWAKRMHAPLIMCSSKTSIHVKQVFTVVVGSVFQIQIKSKQNKELKDGAILEYGVIYEKKKKGDKDKKKDKKKGKKSKKKDKKNSKKKRKNKGSDKSSSSDDTDHSDTDNSDQDDEKGGD